MTPVFVQSMQSFPPLVSPLNAHQYAAGLRLGIDRARDWWLAAVTEEDSIQARETLDWMLGEYSVAMDRLGREWRRAP